MTAQMLMLVSGRLTVFLLLPFTLCPAAGISFSNAYGSGEDVHLDANTYADDKKTTGRAYAHVTGTNRYFGEADTASVSCWGNNCDTGKKTETAPPTVAEKGY